MNLAVFKNTSRFVKFVCISITIGYVLSFFDDSVRILSVTPGYLAPPNFWIWTVFTFWALEVHFLNFLADVLTVGLCGKLIEPLWGELEMFKFFAINNFGVALISAIYSLLYAMISQDSEHLFEVHIFGMSGYLGGIAVAVSQQLPDHLIGRTPCGRFTNRNVPLTALLLSIFLWALGLMNGSTPVQLAAGIYISFIYLRFYQRHSRDSRGDSSENFTFASFFPTVMQPFINLLATPTYNVCLRLGVVRKPASRTAENVQLSAVSVTFPHDIERRRQIALKALNERLSKSGGSKVPKSFALPPSSSQSSFMAALPSTSAASAASSISSARSPPSTSEDQQPLLGAASSDSTSETNVYIDVTK